MIDWSDFDRKPTKKEVSRYRKWVKYLKDSKLTGDQIEKRARYYTEKDQEPPND